MIGFMLANCWWFVVSRWAAVQNFHLATSLANEPFVNKGPTVIQSLSAHVHSKLMRSMFTYFWHINLTISQRIPQTANGGQTICATWVSLLQIHLIDVQIYIKDSENRNTKRSNANELKISGTVANANGSKVRNIADVCVCGIEAGKTRLP